MSRQDIQFIFPFQFPQELAIHFQLPIVLENASIKIALKVTSSTDGSVCYIVLCLVVGQFMNAYQGFKFALILSSLVVYKCFCPLLCLGEFEVDCSHKMGTKISRKGYKPK